MVSVQDRPAVQVQSLPITPPEAGVIQDARARRRRHRRAGAAIALAIALIGPAFVNAGGGNGAGGSRAPIQTGGASFAQGASMRLPRGRTTFTFLVHGIAGHAFDARFQAPEAAAIAVTTNIGPGAGLGPTFHTLTDRQDCRTVSAQTSCVVHFAAGGVPGGTWRWTVTKTSIAAAKIHISVTFNRHLGDYPG